MRTFMVATGLLMAVSLWAAEPPAAKTKPTAVSKKGLTPDNPEPPAYVPLLDAALEGPMAGVEEIVFAVRVWVNEHWYANFGYTARDPSKRLYGDGGRLCRLNLRTKEVKTLLDDPLGGVRDPQVHYGAKKILFSYRKGGSEHYHLYEINADGSGLRQLTDGPYDDIEPTYLPGGDIIFVSSRCNRFVQCWHTRVGTLYRCNGDGAEIRPLSANMEHDNTPWLLPDGRVIYQRWEYIDRGFTVAHHLWTMNPDGTGQMVYFGNQKPGLVMTEAKPIPGTNKVVAVFQPGHGAAEHMGTITIIDPAGGPDDWRRAKGLRMKEKDRNTYRDPFPFSEDLFLVCNEKRILLMNARGELDLVYELPRGPGEAPPAGLNASMPTGTVGSELWVHEPMPLVPRPREPLMPDHVDLRQETGRVFLADILHGRNIAGVRPGEIKKLLVLESLPKPINYDAFTSSAIGAFTLERVLGTVPVEPDGSAYAEVPALRSLFFVALDEQGLSVKRMQSFLTVQPGETFGCAGCHEHRTDAPRPRPLTMAMVKAPARIEPFADIPDVLDFPRDVHPILQRRCVSCHGAGEKPKGDVALDDPKTAYRVLTDRKRNLIPNDRNGHSNRPPRTIGTSACRLMEKIDGRHQKVALTAVERQTIMLWIETGAFYAGTYGALRNKYMVNVAEFRPDPNYVREMKRCGILPESLDARQDPLDCYAVDRAYWQSFWHRGASAPGGAGETALHVPGERSAH
jgi:hypothetical protein